MIFNDKVTAIIPNYNDALLLPNAIQSLLNQTMPLHEIIIVDDGSTDHSLQVIERFKEEHCNIRLIQLEKNGGVAHALNQGIEHATGDYLILGAADDTYSQYMVALAKSAIQQNPRVGLICGDAVVNRFDMDSSFLRTLPYKKKNAWITPSEFYQSARSGYVDFNAGGGMLMQRKAVIEAGMLYPNLKWHCDWLLYFAIAFQHGIHYVDKVFININMRDTGYSEGKRQFTTQKKVILDTILTIREKYPNLVRRFKKTGLLPHYSMRYIPMLLTNKQLRPYFTTRLLWKCMINNRFVIRIGRLFPYKIILRARKLLRA